jgi:S-adenosylmethionine/arginine decarboxylase-like enzyme
VAAAFTHLLADFADVPASQLRDPAFVTGLLIAAASAAGFIAHVTPMVRALPHDGVVGVFALEDSSITVHTFPARRLLLLDIVAPSSFHDAQKAIDVFARRLEAGAVRSGQHPRG